MVLKQDFFVHTEIGIFVCLEIALKSQILIYPNFIFNPLGKTTKFMYDNKFIIYYHKIYTVSTNSSIKTTFYPYILKQVQTG